MAEPLRGESSATAREFPPSFHQERIWFIDQFETGTVYPGSPSYHNVPLIVALEGPVDPSALEDCIRELVRRHSALRTAFVDRAGAVVQVVNDGSTLQLERIDATCVPGDGARDDAVAKALAHAEAPFALDEAPLVRAAWIRIRRDESLLVVTTHHIITDRASQQILLADLAAIYDSRIRGLEPGPQPSIEFADFAEWQRELPEESLEDLLFYWRWQLRGGLAPLELPTDRSRPAVQEFSPGRYSMRVDAELTTQLLAQATQSSSEPFSVLLSGFLVLLRRYAQQDEIVVGTSLPCRDHADVEGLVGPVANLVVLRNDLGGNPTAAELVAKTDNVLRGARRFQDMPFDRLVSSLDPEKDMSRTALFDVLVTWEPDPPAPVSMGGVNATIIETNLGFGKYDLNLSIREAREGLDCELVYNAVLFDARHIEQMMRHFERVLRGLAHDPGRTIDELPLLTEDEERQQLEEWNATAAAYPRHATIHALFEAQVRKNPRRVAVRCGSEALTYGELDERANQLAHRLATLGVGRETLVAVCLERSVEMIVSLLAVLKAGAAYLPIVPELPPERVQFMVEDAGVSHVVTTAAVGHCFSEAPAVVLLDVDAHEIADQPVSARFAGSRPSDLAYCLYTSGSTGRPKGVLVEHRQVVRLLVNDAMPFEFDERDVWTLLHSYAFDFSVWEMYGALLHGGTVIVVPGDLARDPAGLADLLVAERATILNQTPSAFSELASEILSRSTCELALRHVIFGGEALEPSGLRAWRRAYPQVSLVNMYGITEATVHTTFKEIGDLEVDGDASTIGAPIPTATVHVLDRQLRLLPVGVPGEICVGGAGVCRGYLNRDELTARHFVQNPHRPQERLYRSGDRAKRLPNGELVYLGRFDDQVQIRGFRVELGEVQTRLLEHPGVREAVVVAREDVPGGGRLVAYYTEEPGAAPEPDQLRSALQRGLPEYMVPSAFVALASLPRTGNGKIDRHGLPAPNAERDAASARFEEPRTPSERLVANVWAEVLGLEEVGRNSNFFELGGHSLLATRVVSRLRRALACDVPFRALFDTPIVRDFAAQLDATMDGEVASEDTGIARTPRERPLPLSFAQQRLWFLDQLMPGDLAYNVPVAALLDGPLDTQALETALGNVIDRHESLRTCIVSREGVPVQEINPVRRPELFVVDLASLSADAREDELSSLRARVAQRAFDLACDAPLRTVLLRVGIDHHMIVQCLHHIACDLPSIEILLRDLVALYGTECRQEATPLPDLPVQYADYSAWQRERVDDGAFSSQLEYWRRRLAGIVELSLPVDRGDGRGRRSGVETLVLPTGATGPLKQIARRSRASLHMTLLAALKVLLCRLTRQRDLAIASPVANRGRPELEELIGYLSNTVVLRTDLEGAETFREVLERVRETSLEAFSNADVPFDQVVEELRPDRRADRSPLFRAMFAVQQAPSDSIEVAGLCIRPAGIDEGGAKFDLSVYLWETQDRLVGTIVYAAELFESGTIRQLADDFVAVVEQVVAYPSVRIGDLRVGDERSRQRSIAEFNEDLSVEL